MIKTLFTPTQIKMITPDGNIRRYINSDIVDIFEVGDSADISFPNGYNKANRVFKGYSPTITGTTVRHLIIKVRDSVGKVRIRKYTPTEAFKLMGFTVEDCQKCLDGGISKSQIYKQAGNSIGVSVLEAIFTSLGQRYEEFRV